MSNKFTDAMSRMFDVSATVDLLQYDFVQQALIAGAILGLLAGIIGPLIVSRQMSFSVHGTSELSLTGASAALLVGVGVGFGAIVGSVVAAVLFGLLGQSARPRFGDRRDHGFRSRLVGVVPLGVRRSHGNQLLTVGRTDRGAGKQRSRTSAAVRGHRDRHTRIHLPPFAVRKHRPRSCCSSRCSGSGTVDRVRRVGRHHRSTRRTDRRCAAGDVAADHPAAAAAYVTASPLKATILSVVFAELAAVGGILLSLAPGVPVSSFVTSVSFVIYLICRLFGSARRKNAGRIPAHA